MFYLKSSLQHYMYQISKLSIHKMKTNCPHVYQLVINCNKVSHCNMICLSIWDKETQVDITDQFHKNYRILLLPLLFLLVLFHISVFINMAWSRHVEEETFFIFQQYHNGKGGNTVTVGGAKMEFLGDKKRPLSGRREMQEKDTLLAPKLTKFTNSQFTLVCYKCRTRSTIKRWRLLTCIDRPEVHRYPVWTTTAQSIG